jgi:hypothetical protein
MGEDARYTHFLGEGDYASTSRIQFDIVEADVQAHMPYFTAGGEELKIGQFPTLLGSEGIDPRGNFFYSHSYIFNFGLPLKDTGAMLVTHVIPLIDVYTGVITGVNTSFGPGGDNNGALAFEGGIGLNISDSLTVLATTNIGPEDACTPGTFELYACNSAMRYYGDVVITWKINDKLTSTTELNIVTDNGPFGTKKDEYSPSAGGAAEYLTYTINDIFTVGARAEIFRDANGFFVTAFPSSGDGLGGNGNFDFVNSEYGCPAGKPCVVLGTGVPTTYGELTIGVNIKPPVPDVFKGFVIRPEFRVDDVLSGPNAFNITGADTGFKATSKTQETAAVDFVLPF